MQASGFVRDRRRERRAREMQNHLQWRRTGNSSRRALTETLKLKHIFEKSTTLTLSKYSKRRKLGPKISYVNSYHWMLCEVTMRTRVKQAERAGEHKMRLRRIQCDSRSEREYTHFPGVSCGSVAVSVYERKCALKMSLFLFDWIRTGCYSLTVSLCTKVFNL